MEQWKPIVGYEGLYEVSNAGRVRSIARIVPNPRWGTQQVSAKLLSTEGVSSKGYHAVTLSKLGKHKVYAVHSLVLTMFAGPCPNGMQARHLNGDRSDNRWPENLLWGTVQQNADDRTRHGTVPKGEAHHAAKLTENDVREIRRLKGVISQRKLAVMYSVHRDLVLKIQQRKIWKHL